MRAWSDFFWPSTRRWYSRNWSASCTSSYDNFDAPTEPSPLPWSLVRAGVVGCAELLCGPPAAEAEAMPPESALGWAMLWPSA
eukprot:scaffold1248_cov393-Prasinococcus_capsulatus_cf.AAC.2